MASFKLLWKAAKRTQRAFKVDARDAGNVQTNRWSEGKINFNFLMYRWKNVFAHNRSENTYLLVVPLPGTVQFYLAWRTNHKQKAALCELERQVLNRTAQHFNDWEIDSTLSRSWGNEDSLYIPLIAHSVEYEWWVYPWATPGTAQTLTQSWLGWFSFSITPSYQSDWSSFCKFMTVVFLQVLY